MELIVPRSGCEADPVPSAETPRTDLAAQQDTPSRKDVGRLLLRATAFLVVYWNVLYLGNMFYRTPDNDFSRAYYSAVAFLKGESMYGTNTATEAYFRDAEHPTYLWNLNPPHFQLLLLPLAPLPVFVALVLWCVLNGLCLWLGLRLVVREVGLPASQRRLAFFGLLGFCGFTTALWCGHCSFILFWIVTCLWVDARRGRWNRSGAWLGLGLSLKPFLLIVVPYLLLRRRWRALGAMAGVTALCFGVGLAIFGVENHREWMSKLPQAGEWSWQIINGSLFGLLTRTLTPNPVVESVANIAPQLVWLLWLALGVLLGLVTLAVAASDDSRAGVDQALALLLVGALLLSPLGWTYYYTLPLGPVAAVTVCWWRQSGTASSWSRGLFLVALGALLWPAWATRLFQPQPLATLLIANVYSLGTLAVWLALVLEGWRRYRLRVNDQLNALPILK